MVWHGGAWCGRQGTAWPGRAWHGAVGQAGLGEVRQGQAWRGKAGIMTPGLGMVLRVDTQGLATLLCRSAVTK